MESFPQSKLPKELQPLYQKFASKFAGMSEDDFMEMRGDALGRASTTPKEFTEVNGQLMAEIPNPDEIEEIKDTQRDA